MLSRIFTTDGLSYIAIKAVRDFAVVFAGLVTVDGFTLSQGSLVTAATAAATTTIFRLVREVLFKFETDPDEDI